MLRKNNYDLFEEIDEHKNSISHSFFCYRHKAKIQKIAVLEAASYYLIGKISKDHLLALLEKNDHYADALGKSKTKILIEKVLKEKPSARRTKEGYIKLRSFA